jgi:hypothetical protein
VELVLLIARFDAFINAIRKAPVTLGPRPMDVANAGTSISDAKARPVPSMREPEFLLPLTVACIACALAMLFSELTRISRNYV